MTGLISGEVEAELQALVAAGDEASLRRALELDATHKPAAVGLAQLLLAEGRAEEAIAALTALPADDEDVAALLEAARSGALPAAERSRIEDRLGALLDSVKGDDDARQEFVALLEELTTGDPTGAAEWRRRLSTRLF